MQYHWTSVLGTRIGADLILPGLDPSMINHLLTLITQFSHRSSLKNTDPPSHVKRQSCWKSGLISLLMLSNSRNFSVFTNKGKQMTNYLSFFNYLVSLFLLQNMISTKSLYSHNVLKRLLYSELNSKPLLGIETECKRILLLICFT